MTEYTRKALLCLISAITLLIPGIAGAVAAKDIENVHLQNRNRFVTDQAGVLSPAGIARADSILADIWQQTGAEPVVAIIDSTDGEDIDEYATELFSSWGIGKKDRDNGLLILISVGDKRNIFRTGYGTEGVLPDAACWTISTRYMNPEFKLGNYDAGLCAGLEQVRAAMTSEEAREELASQMPNDNGARDNAGEDEDFFSFYLTVACIAAVGLLLLVIYLIFSTRDKPTVEAYNAWNKWKLPALIVTVLFMGIPAIGLVIMLLMMRHLRLHKHLCPNCGTRMHRLDEVTDNQYLTPAQDLEEHLKSVDYDVWLCPSCHERDIIPYINPLSSYQQCPRCGAHAEQLVGERITRQPTASSTGEAVRIYRCANCGNNRTLRRTLPKAIDTPVIIGGFGGGHGGRFSGGGGSFGGGMTGGGGSSSGW